VVLLGSGGARGANVLSVLVLARVESGLESVRMRQKGEKGNLLCRHTCSCSRRTLVPQLETLYKGEGTRVRTLVLTTNNRRLARGADELTVLLGCIEFVLKGQPLYTSHVMKKTYITDTLVLSSVKVYNVSYDHHE
jgi:hypothetical protein